MLRWLCVRPEGAETDQPRAERSAALGNGLFRNVALKGETRRGGAAVPPFQGLVFVIALTQGDAARPRPLSLCPGLAC